MWTPSDSGCTACVMMPYLIVVVAKEGVGFVSVLFVGIMTPQSQRAL